METKLKNVAVKAAQFNPEHREGKVARTIEDQTSKLPSDIFLWASVGAMTTALAFKLLKKDHLSLFFGQWVAPMLLFGVYNKIVKIHGSD
jgi:hypothetical protein